MTLAKTCRRGILTIACESCEISTQSTISWNKHTNAWVELDKLETAGGAPCPAFSIGFIPRRPSVKLASAITLLPLAGYLLLQPRHDHQSYSDARSTPLYCSILSSERSEDGIYLTLRDRTRSMLEWGCMLSLTALSSWTSGKFVRLEKTSSMADLHPGRRRLISMKVEPALIRYHEAYLNAGQVNCHDAREVV